MNIPALPLQNRGEIRTGSPVEIVFGAKGRGLARRRLYLSFRIRFSGEESAVVKAPGVNKAGCPSVSLPLRDLGREPWDDKDYHAINAR
jgi:hypothetical protein